MNPIQLKIGLIEKLNARKKRIFTRFYALQNAYLHKNDTDNSLKKRVIVRITEKIT